MEPTLERSFRGHRDIISGLAFSPDMKQLVSSSYDNCVMVWNFRPQLRAYRYVGHTDQVFDIDYASTGKYIASGSRDCTIRLWTPGVRGDSVIIKAHKLGVRSVHFSHDASQLLSAGDDKAVKIWDVASRRFICALNQHKNWVRSAQFSPDARLVVTGSDDKTVKVFDKGAKKCLHTYYEHDDIVTQVRFHPDGTCVASCSADKSINIWDLRSQTLIQHYQTPSICTHIAFHPSGNYLSATMEDHSVKLYDLKEGRGLYTIHGHEGATTCSEFSPNGNFLATASKDAMVMVWKTDFEAAPETESETSRVSNLSMSRTASPGTKKSQHTASMGQIRKGTGHTGALQSASNAATPLSRKDGVLLPSKKTSLSRRVQSKAALSGEDRPILGGGGMQEVQSTNTVRNEDLSNETTRKLNHIMGQLEILTRSMNGLEERLTLNEDRVGQVWNVQCKMMESGVAESTPPRSE